MNNQIEPTQEYLPSEIAKHGWILSGWGNKSTRHVLRLIEKGKLKAKPYVVSEYVKVYKVKGKDIIDYQNKLEEKKNAKKPSHTPIQPQ